MPMDYSQISLELDAVEKRGAGRIPQEVAKSGPSGPGSSNPYPEGIPPELMKHKMEKTKAAVGAEITQVLRRENEL